MITGIGKAVLDVEDQDSAIEFWVEKAGFELVSDASYGTERWVEVRPPGGAPVLVLHQRAPGEARPEAPEQLPHSNVFFTCEDLQATYEAMVERGVRFPSPPVEMHFGWWSMFEDHEGTRYALVPAARTWAPHRETDRKGRKGMQQRVSVVTLGVRDLERSRRFYEDGLGWERSTKDEGIVFFQANGSVIALFPRDELAADARLEADGQGFAGLTLAYCTRAREEVDEVMAEAAAAGARILKPADDTFWGGYSGYFADPDGFAWEVAWNPAWGMTDEGDVVLNPPR